MKKNIGKTDKIIRFIAAALFILLYFTNVITGVLGIILVAFGIIFVVTALISFCPLYLPLGLNTADSKNSKNNSWEE